MHCYIKRDPLMAAAFIAVGASIAHADEISGKLTFYTHFGQFVDSGDWERWASAFEEKYPDTDVEVLHVANYRKEMPTRIASGDYGDVLNVLDNLPPSEYAEFYMPLSDMSLADTHSFVDRYKVDGEVYGYIYGANAEAVVYNKAAFERAGIADIPTTRTELFEACEKLKAESIVPFQINMGAGWPMQQWDKAALLMAGDGSYFDQAVTDPTPYADGKPYGEAMRFVRDLFEAGCTERDYTANNWDESKMMLGAGEAGMWFLANWSIPQVVVAGEALGVENVSADLGMFPLPNDAGSIFSETSSTRYVDWCYSHTRILNCRRDMIF